MAPYLGWAAEVEYAEEDFTSRDPYWLCSFPPSLFRLTPGGECYYELGHPS